MKIREIQPSDAQSLIDFFKVVDSETIYLIAEPGERNRDVEQQSKRIQKILESHNSVLWGAFENDTLVGMAGLHGGVYKRVQHIGLLVVAIRESHWGRGLGSQLLDRLIDFAKSHGISRIELNVHPKNEKAKSLYTKKGFVTEGIRRASFYTGGLMYDQEFMALVF